MYANVGHSPVYYRVKVASATLTISILCLPQAVDCGDGLIHLWGLGCLCSINVQLYSFVAEYEWALLVKTTDTWVAWNSSASGNTSVPPNSIHVLKPQKGGPFKGWGNPFHPSKLLW